LKADFASSFLGYVDLLGTTYSSPTLATGFGAHIAQPLLREAFEAKAGEDGKGPLLTREEAEKVMDDCMKVLFYRDARSINKVRIFACACSMALTLLVSNRDRIR
jgi:20S proteasome subunit beta 7